jgi:hypothetical protein
MEENDKKDSNINATIQAVTGLVTAIPVYQDTLQPAAKQIGSTLETVTKAVNIVLFPIRGLVWGYEQIESFVTKSVSEKLKNVPEENIVTPPPSIAGPVFEALRFSGEDIDLRELYTNLLASAMDNSTQYLVHPGYVEILKNLCSDEAKLLQVFTEKAIFPLINIIQIIPETSGELIVMNNFSHFRNLADFKRPDLIPSYLDNICRLGLTEIPEDLYLSSPNTYDELENDELIIIAEKAIEANGNTMKISKKVIRITNYGKLFINNVVKERR